ncbi:glucose-1-phosphate cytidylyltransferase [Spirochaetia bacterium]|nr:glucose-1-phosphate cytidylyltransferase [Spirochaetia bacterium]GHV92563.1 glucose-1-phosphate cytidylyltransferase [Spirochaetia bacterium]
MKVVLLAGGYGTRLSEETELRPKPMVEIGGRPILWHIMKTYSWWGFNEFVILTGYLSHVIKDYFINYYTRYSDITVDMANNAVEIHNHRNEPWKVTMLYTGQNTMTGGRLLAAKDFIGNERFMLTYGDGVSDVNIPELIQCHEKSGKYATLTAVRPAGRFGALDINDEGAIAAFKEKPDGDGAWINGGFFVMEPQVFDYLTEGEATVLERKPLENLAADGQLNAFRHSSFWRAMDTLKDKNDLTALWTAGTAQWALWQKESR